MDTSVLTTKNDQVAAAIAALASAEAEVQHRTEQQAKQAAQEVELQEELKQLESEMGAKVLAAIESGRDVSKAVASEIESKRTALEVAKAVSYAMIPKLAGAKKAVITARAAVLRAEADRLDVEVSKRQAITDAFLSDLADFEGCAYQYDSGVPAPTLVNSKMLGGAPNVVRLKLPFTLLLQNRAGGLRVNADFLERGQPMETDIYTGAPVTPYVIDYEGGRVLIPEPAPYTPPTFPAASRRSLELLDLDKAKAAENKVLTPFEG